MSDRERARVRFSGRTIKCTLRSVQSARAHTHVNTREDSEPAGNRRIVNWLVNVAVVVVVVLLSS